MLIARFGPTLRSYCKLHSRRAVNPHGEHHHKDPEIQEGENNMYFFSRFLFPIIPDSLYYYTYMRTSAALEIDPKLCPPSGLTGGRGSCSVLKFLDPCSPGTQPDCLTQKHQQTGRNARDFFLRANHPSTPVAYN